MVLQCNQYGGVVVSQASFTASFFAFCVSAHLCVRERCRVDMCWVLPSWVWMVPPLVCHTSVTGFEGKVRQVSVHVDSWIPLCNHPRREGLIQVWESQLADLRQQRISLRRFGPSVYARKVTLATGAIFILGPSRPATTRNGPVASPLQRFKMLNYGM